jgi:hypothetical protein
MKKLILLAHLLYFSSNIFGQQYVWTTAPFDATSINLNGAAFESNGILWGPKYNINPGFDLGHIGKYDGTNLTIYTPSTTNYGVPVYPYKVVVDANNSKWIAARQFSGLGSTFNDTLCNFNGSTWTKNQIVQGKSYILSDFLIDNNNIKVFVRYRQDSLTGLFSFQVHKYINSNWLLITDTNMISINGLNILIIDNNNNLWVSDATNLHKLDIAGNWTSYPIANFGVTGGIGAETMQADNNGNIWIVFGGFGSSSIVKFNGTTWTRYTTLNSGLLFNTIDDLEFDGSGNLWIAGRNTNTVGPFGLQKFDGQNWSPKINTPNVPIGLTWTTMKMIFAPNGNLWIQGKVGNNDLIAYTDFSTTTSNDNSIQSALKIYPNPTLGNLSISHPNVSEFETVEIYDVYGRNITVPHTFTHSTMELETQSLPAGYYTLSIKTPKGILRNSWIKQ